MGCCCPCPENLLVEKDIEQRHRGLCANRSKTDCGSASLRQRESLLDLVYRHGRAPRTKGAEPRPSADDPT